MMMKHLLTMWLSPRLIAWFALTTILGVLARLPFSHFQIIPHHLDFNPGVVFVPLFGVFFGPAGAWGSVAASLIGDRLIGPWGAFSIFRALGFFLFSLSAQKMWNFSFWFEAGHVKPAHSWSHTARFILVSWPGCALAASWQGLGSELLRLYPFTYVASLLVLNNILFCTLLGLPLYRLMAGLWAPHFRMWNEVVGVDTGSGSPSLRNAIFITAGSVAALLTGFYISELVYHVSPLQPFALGACSGILVPLVVTPMLIVNATGLFWEK
jgi:energy-coupling factor transport system substrate-specific component